MCVFLIEGLNYLYQNGEKMPRKSATQRLEEVSSLLDQYEKDYSDAQRAFFSWDVSFLGAMKDKLAAGKVLSKRMRDKVDQLVADGIKQLPDNCPTADEWCELASYLPPREADILGDFANRLRRGWTLTERQQEFALSLTKLATDVKNDNIWKPSDEDIEEMKLILALGSTYDPGWLANNPGAERVLWKIKDFFNPEDHKIFEERNLEYARKRFGARIRKIKNSKFSAGDIGYVTIRNSETREMEKHAVLVVGPAQIETPPEDGHRKVLRIVFPVLIQGKLTEISEDHVKKR